MKKVVLLVLSLLLIFAFTACSKSKDDALLSSVKVAIEAEKGIIISTIELKSKEKDPTQSNQTSYYFYTEYIYDDSTLDETQKEIFSGKEYKEIFYITLFENKGVYEITYILPMGRDEK